MNIDTTPEVQSVVTRKLRAMTATQKLDLAIAMSRATRELAVAGIRLRHPEASDREVLLRLAIVLHGRELASAAYPDILDLDGP